MGKEETNRPGTEELEERTAERGAAADGEAMTADAERPSGEKRKKRAGKKAGGAGRKFLGLAQHIALAVMVIAVCVVAGASGFRVDAFQNTYTLGYSLYDQSKNYEDTSLFTGMFGWVFSDVVRHGVMSGQMETDGRFDGSKVIDVTAYNYRQTELPAQYVTAEYRLEDLLKWQSYGFETRTETMTPEQAAAFLSDRTRLTIASSDGTDGSAEVVVTASDSRADDGLHQTDVSGNVLGNQLWVYTDGGGTYAESTDDGEATYTDEDENYPEENNLERNNLLVNRYLTVDGGKLEDYVSDWDLYYDLCNQVKTAANYPLKISCSIAIIR